MGCNAHGSPPPVFLSEPEAIMEERSYQLISSHLETHPHEGPHRVRNFIKSRARTSRSRVLRELIRWPPSPLVSANLSRNDPLTNRQSIPDCEPKLRPTHSRRALNSTSKAPWRPARAQDRAHRRSTLRRPRRPKRFRFIPPGRRFGLDRCRDRRDRSRRSQY